MVKVKRNFGVFDIGIDKTLIVTGGGIFIPLNREESFCNSLQIAVKASEKGGVILYFATPCTVSCDSNYIQYFYVLFVVSTFLCAFYNSVQCLESIPYI